MTKKHFYYYFLFGLTYKSNYTLIFFPGISLREMMNIYFQVKDKVFGLTRPFSDKKLVEKLRDILGDKVMNDLQTCK